MTNKVGPMGKRLFVGLIIFLAVIGTMMVGVNYKAAQTPGKHVAYYCEGPEIGSLSCIEVAPGQAEGYADRVEDETNLQINEQLRGDLYE